MIWGKKLTIAHVAMSLLVLAAVMSYFNKSHAPQMELVTPRQELPSYHEAYPGDTHLADRVAKSYALALVLVQSPYSQKNAVGLTSLRAWARHRFQRQPDFLYPLTLEAVDNTRQNFIGACLYNLCSPIQYWLEDKIGRFIKGRIAAFHVTDGYNSFRNAYFDLFGVDADSAMLLARYQSDKARSAIDICLAAVVLAIAGIVLLVHISSATPALRPRALQMVLAFAWCLVSGCYFVVSWSQNDLSALVSAAVAAGIGVYLFKPFVVEFVGDILQIKFNPIPTNWLAVAYWVSYSLLVIQVVTWMRTGSLENSDPISLLISSFTGNFLQDAVHAKRIILRVLAVTWLVVGLWVATRFTRDTQITRQAEEALASLKGPL